MKEYNLTEVQNGSAQNLPAVVGMWTKIRKVLTYKIDLNMPVVIELTAKQAKVIKEVRNFWFQEIEFPELHDFFFKDLNIFKKK